MAMSLEKRLVPEQRMHTITIDEILSMGNRLSVEYPPLEHYFSPPH
jgi:hypothetical protein